MQEVLLPSQRLYFNFKSYTETSGGAFIIGSEAQTLKLKAFCWASKGKANLLPFRNFANSENE